MYAVIFDDSVQLWFRNLREKKNYISLYIYSRIFDNVIAK